MSQLNVTNRTLAIMDNLPFLRSINNECIDLIAIDPPFAANETFTAKPKPPITEAEFQEEVELARSHGVAHNEGIGETRVKDVWNWDADVHPAWKMRIEDDYPAVHAVIQSVEACATENEAAYLSFMAMRLLECHRVLKPTGSIYLHCDPTASHYLKLLMDAIFDARHFRNEISWNRANPKNLHRVNFPNNRDVLLRYSRGEKATFHKAFTPLNPTYVDKAYKYTDSDGRRYRILPLLNPNKDRPNLTYEFLGVTRVWRWTRERMQKAYEDGIVVQLKPGAVPGYKFFLDESKGRTATDDWNDIPQASGTEFTGYATQKPLALYERIISASSNPGDVVLDIFAGCATTAVAAEKLGRQWIACDMAYRSWTMLKRRFYQNGYALSDMTDATKEALNVKQETWQSATSHTIGPNELPVRDDQDPAPYHHLEQARRGRRTTQTASWSGRITKEDAKKLLIEKFGPVCWGCGYQPRRPNGTIDDTLLEVDHIRAKRASEGVQGDDELYNLAVLHRTCNGIKRNKLTLEELRTHNAHHGLLYVNTIGELVDLFEATKFANDQIARHVAEHGYQAPSDGTD